MFFFDFVLASKFSREENCDGDSIPFVVHLGSHSGSHQLHQVSVGHRDTGKTDENGNDSKRLGAFLSVVVTQVRSLRF